MTPVSEGEQVGSETTSDGSPATMTRAAPVADTSTARSGRGTSIASGSGGFLLRRMVVYLPGSVVPAILALVTSTVFTRVYTAAEFGMFSLAAIVVATPLKVVSTTWLVQSVGKYLPPVVHQDGRRHVLDAVTLGTVLIVGAQLVLGTVGYVVGRQVLHEEWRGFLLPALLFVVATSLFEVATSTLAAEARASGYTAAKLADSVLTLVLRLVLVSGLVSMDVTLMLWSVVISNGVLVPLMWWRIGLASPHRALALARSPETRRLARSFVGFGLPMTAWLLSSILLDVGDRWVIKLLLGSDDVGIYDASYRLIAGVAALMVVPITITVHPYVMSLADSDSDSDSDDGRAGQVIGTVVDNLTVLAMVSVGLIFVLRHDLALVLLGPEFREGSKIMPVVLAGVFLFNIGTFAHKPFEILGRTRTMVVVAFASAGINMALCFALIPFMGYAGAAWATLLSYLVYTVVVGARGRRLIPWHLDVKRIVREGTLVACAYGAIEAVRWLTHLPYAVDLVCTAAAALAVAGFRLWRLVRRQSIQLAEVTR
jgi:O-antigen/teichoic acid export membrane protein